MASEATTASLAIADLERCSIDRWYPKLARVSIRTTLLPLSDDFVSYLHADSVFVATDADAEGSDHLSDGGVDWESDSADANESSRFPELEASITSAIEKHGGACFPKLNWSAPKDAAWVLGGSLKCTSPRDVLLLLKSSDNIAHDLCDAQRSCADAPVPTAGPAGEGVGQAMQQLGLEPPPPPPSGAAATAVAAAEPGSTHRWVLALRRWCNLRPSSEFRCFCCAGGVLVAACQRDRFSHYAFLHESRDRLVRLLSDFARHQLREAELPSRFVFDAYVDVDERVHLVDVAPFHESTDPVLLEWGSLRAAADALEAAATSPQARPHAAELALVEEGGGGVAPSAQMYYGLPHDLRQHGAADLAALIETAKEAAASGGAQDEEDGLDAQGEGSATGDPAGV